MKISHQWLTELTDLQKSPEEFADILTSIGLEVEGIYPYKNLPYRLAGVKTGRVIHCVQHPNADRLKLTKVDIGNGEILPIVCGAPNVAEGQKVMVATIGTQLPDGKGGVFEIKEAKIRGELSKGMICAEDELGIGSSHDGILVLPEDTPIGLDAESFFGIVEDTIYEIGLTPNRSDANCHLGVARDLLAYYKVHENFSGKIRLKETTPVSIGAMSGDFTVSIEDELRCQRYMGLYFEDIKIGPSPSWIKYRLEALGQTSINNVVDITNLVLLEYGCPLHAFDAEKISGKKIKVKTLGKNTLFKALDGKDYKLDDQDLMICDANDQPLCMAGVYGGLSSGITEKTRSVFLEAAVFLPSTVRKSSKRHQLYTQASKAFEKGVDEGILAEALARATYLLIKYASAKPAHQAIDVYPNPRLLPQIVINADYFNRISGLALTKQDIRDILAALDMEVKDSGAYLEVAAPSNKVDVRRPIDLVEEILRIYGLDRIPVSDKIKVPLDLKPQGQGSEFVRQLGDFLAANGYVEMMGLSLSQSIYYDKFIPVPSHELVKVHNTSNTQLDVMRYSMIPGGLESIAYNMKRKQQDLRLFELGKVYKWLGEEIIETDLMTIWQVGSLSQSNWISKGQPASLYSIIGVTRQICQKCGVDDLTIKPIDLAEYSTAVQFFHGEKLLATLGQISVSLCKAFDIKTEVYSAEIYLGYLTDIACHHRVEVREVSKYQEVKRDLALILDKDITFAEVCQVAKESFSHLIRNIELFDVYENEHQLGINKKSYAITMTLQSSDHALTDEELETFLQNIIHLMEKRLGAVIRR